MRQHRLWDVVILNDELDMLGLRLAYLSPVVDFFLVVEADRTFAGEPKPLHLSADLQRFADYGTKLIPVVAVLPEHAGSPWEREIAQRDVLYQALAERCASGDNVLVSDVDEIPFLSALAGLHRENQPPSFLSMTHCNLYANWTLPAPWRHPIFTSFDEMGHTVRRAAGLASPELPLVLNSGMHLSFVGGSDLVLSKLASYSHQEFNRPAIANQAFLQECVRHRVAPDKGGLLEPLPEAGEPDLLTFIRGRYPHFIGGLDALPSRRRRAFSGWATLRRSTAYGRLPTWLTHHIERSPYLQRPLGLLTFRLKHS